MIKVVDDTVLFNWADLSCLGDQDKRWAKEWPIGAILSLYCGGYFHRHGLRFIRWCTGQWVGSWKTLMNLPHCNGTCLMRLKPPSFQVWICKVFIYEWSTLCAITALFIPQDSCCGQGSSHTSIFEPTGDVHWPCWWVSICWYLNKTLELHHYEFY